MSEAEMRREDVIRKEILAGVAEIYALREAEKRFIPGTSKVNYAGRVFDEKEMRAAVDSLLDFWLTLGDKGTEFVEDFCVFHDLRYGLVTNSGSSANLIALSALCSPAFEGRLQKGDEVITTASAFPTTVNPILQNALTPVFIDIEEDTYNIDSSKIEAAISPKTRALMFAHTLGNPAQMDVIMDIARKNGLYVIEDTCDALDSKYGGQLCGTFGDIATYSFYAAHHITMGEGGALLTNNLSLYRQALSIRDWGRACFCRTGEDNPDGACGHRFEQKFVGLPDGYDHKYIYSNIGYNLKPLDLQCAIGIEQLKKLPEFTRKRRENFKVLYEDFQQYAEYFILPRALPKAEPSWFALPITVKENAGFTRKEIVTYLESKNIETRMLFSGNILRHPAYKNITCRIAGELTNTEQVMQRTFFIGVYPGLNDEKLDYIKNTLGGFFS
ncbi:lipopolysaccharide biosynthesis protein RfbH [Desulfosporosinus nitroreducens]|uniref:Lipopolysaccharide biosynthesis protein RfbH n=1 Tax=Desulfosporosinus nitroreducens TaxID=2018668 RepID=A0ABT8QVZ5_9FIRM|nr:lipopolysaccharide biosynthesis protein RfbH [Desulfosporosinus nitroreducens]MDO0825355.1 lipopolysaccharide biosynthesis protein RfbH [Desulfosporosinus nitroreducens]